MNKTDRALSEKSPFSSSLLKLIAIITMLIDHTAVVLVQQGYTYIIMRSIGRLAFPIFCFLITEGFIHTSNVKKYASRLGFFALISEIPFNFAAESKAFFPEHQNVFFTLFLGLLAIWITDKFKNKPYIGACAIILFSLLAEYTYCDYGWYGVALIACFYIFKNKNGVAILVFFALTLLYVLRTKYYLISFALMQNVSIADSIRVFFNMSIPGFFLNYCRQLFACGSAVFIALYNGKKGFIKGKALKYAFYVFYPAHLMILYIIKILL